MPGIPRAASLAMCSEAIDASKASTHLQRPRSMSCRSRAPAPQPMLSARSNVRPLSQVSNHSIGHWSTPPNHLVDVMADGQRRHPSEVCLLFDFPVPEVRHVENTFAKNRLSTSICESKPQSKRSLDTRHLLARKFPEPAQQFGCWNRDEALRVKRTLLEERNRKRCLESRSTHRGGMRNERYRARSTSETGTLMTRQGRTFAAKPRSTSHASPRLGAFTCRIPADRSREKPDRLR